MGVKVNTDMEMTPRARIGTSVPYAMTAGMVDLSNLDFDGDW